jgi:hypothetical protein
VKLISCCLRDTIYIGLIYDTGSVKCFVDSDYADNYIRKDH